MKRVVFLLTVVVSMSAAVLLASCEFRLVGTIVNSFQPDVVWGGRAVAVSIHPSQSHFMVAASETGGVFRSQDGGRRWQHMGNPPSWSFSVQDIEYCPRRPQGGYSPIIATTYRDLNTTPNGGIWVAGNTLSSFERPANALPAAGPRCPVQSSAYGISFDPVSGRAYVGTDCGYAFSDDCGLSWTYTVIDPSLPVNSNKTQDRILNIVSSGMGQLYAVGMGGIYYSSDNGGTWNRATHPGLRSIGFKDAPPRLAVSPVDPNVAFLALDDPAATDERGSYAKLYITFDGGRWWHPAMSVANEARQAIVLTTPYNYRNPEAEGFTLYWGSGARLFRTALNQVDLEVIRSIAFEEIGMDHPDVQDLAFDPQTGVPLLLATDGGVHLTPNNGANWAVTGGGIHGFQALQIYQVLGQFKVDGADYEHTDLYFGTHDNGFWYSRDGGRNWLDAGVGGEGAGLNALRSTNSYGETWITGYLCGNCYSFLTGPHFGHDSLFGAFRRWQNAGDVKLSEAMPLNTRAYIQFGLNNTRTPGREEYYLFRSVALDLNWQVIEQVDKPVAGRVKESLTASDDLWVTFPVNTGLGNGVGGPLYELRSISNVNAVDAPDGVELYDASENFGSLGTSGYQFSWSPVFGVNPSNPNHIIAADVVSQTMKVSVDGGQSWREDAALTKALTSNGKFDLYVNKGGEYAELLANEISFLPENPNHILIGTKYNGIIKSNDGGLNWEKIPLSERIPHITSFFWDYPNGNVIVSSFGRGLWILRFGKDYFDSNPNNVLEIPQPDPSRQHSRWRTGPTSVAARAPIMMNGMPLLASGEDLMIDGAGFEPSPGQQSPVEILLDGELLEQVFPDSEGKFEASLQVILPDGLYTLEVVQATSEGNIGQTLSFQVASLDKAQVESQGE